MTVRSLSRLGVVAVTIAAAGVVATPSAYAESVTIEHANPGPVVAGGQIKATATLGSGLEIPAKLQIKLHTGANCTGDVIGASRVFGENDDNTNTGNDITTGGGTYTYTVQNVDAGTYSWSATLDEADESPQGDCTNSSVTVGKATPSIAQAVTNASVGGTVKNTATLVNRVKPDTNVAGVKITFALYGPNDTNCTGTPIDTSTHTVGSSTSSYASDAMTVPAAGTYRWRVGYSGDTNNNAVTTTCGAAQSVVTSGGTPPPPPPSNAVKCQGLVADYVGSKLPERIIGSSGDDVIVARGGADIIEGNGGNDVICAGGGNDTVLGGRGNDILRGGDGRDTVAGGKGNDTLYGDAEADRLSGGPGNDRLSGGSGNDFLNGGTGTDRANGGPGTDVGRNLP